MERFIKALLAVLSCFAMACGGGPSTLNNKDSEAKEEVGEATFTLVAANGFTYPVDALSSWANGNFAACGMSYYTNLCHNGNDIATGDSAPATVYAMAAGTVIARSGTQDTANNCPSGWGYDYLRSNTCNMALAVQHYDDDGNPFVVVYGHLRYDASYNTGTTITPGQTIGVTGRYLNVNGTRISGDHLHWGVRPGTTIPASNWGRVSCPGASQPPGTSFPAGCDPNGFVAPGTYMGTSGRSWVVPPVAPTLATPLNGWTYTSWPVLFTWSNGSGTYRSHIMVCTNAALTTGCINPDGGGVGIEPTAVGASRATSYNINVGSGTWYWSVRGIAYNDYGGWGSYATVQSVIRP